MKPQCPALQKSKPDSARYILGSNILYLTVSVFYTTINLLIVNDTQELQKWFWVVVLIYCNYIPRPWLDGWFCIVCHSDQGLKLLTVCLSGTGKNCDGQVNIFGSFPKEGLNICLFTLIHISGTVVDRQKQWWTGRSFWYFSGRKAKFFCNFHPDSVCKMKGYLGHSSSEIRIVGQGHLVKKWFFWSFQLPFSCHLQTWRCIDVAAKEVTEEYDVRCFKPYAFFFTILCFSIVGT